MTKPEDTALADRVEGLAIVLCEQLFSRQKEPKRRGRPRSPLWAVVLAALEQSRNNVSARRASKIVEALDPGARWPHYNTVLRFLGDTASTPHVARLFNATARAVASCESGTPTPRTVRLSPRARVDADGASVDLTLWVGESTGGFVGASFELADPTRLAYQAGPGEARARTVPAQLHETILGAAIANLEVVALVDQELGLEVEDSVLFASSRGRGGGGP